MERIRQKEWRGNYWNCFEKELGDYIASAERGESSDEQVPYARFWKESVGMIPELGNPTFLQENGLVDRTEELLPPLEDSCYKPCPQVLTLPFRMIVEQGLEQQETIMEGEGVRLGELIAKHAKAYTVSLARVTGFDGLITGEELRSISCLPTASEPQYILFASSEKLAEMFKNWSDSWVFSGPIICVTEKGLMGLNDGLKIQENVDHELITHGLLQQRLRGKGRRQMLEVELAVLEGMDMTGRNYAGLSREDRYLEMSQDMVSVRLTKRKREELELARRAVREGMEAEDVFSGESRLLASLFCQGFFHFVAQKQAGGLGDSEFTYSWGRSIEGWKSFFTARKSLDFLEWRQENGWKEYESWWREHGSWYSMTALPALLGVENILGICCDSQEDGNASQEIVFVIRKFLRDRFDKELDDLSCWNDLYNAFLSKSSFQQFSFEESLRELDERYIWARTYLYDSWASGCPALADIFEQGMVDY